MAGVFVVIEGIDGSGKTTALNMIKGLLKEQGAEVIAVRQPGGTPLAEKIRNLVIDYSSEEILTDKSEYLLMLAARQQLVSNVIAPALAEGSIVISDRHDWSSYAYQGFKETSLIEFASLEPDLVIYMDKEVSLATNAITSRNNLVCRFETTHKLQLASDRYNELLNLDDKTHLIINANDFNSCRYTNGIKLAVKLIMKKYLGA